MLSKKLMFMLLLLSIARTMLIACTTAVISGKATPDGRPLLWKHRDSDNLDNKLVFFEDGTYNYIGLINSNDSLEMEVWAGSNSAGFSIMNSASYNLKDTKTELSDQEGMIMKRALQQCAALQDFENLLDETSGKRGVEANFGVIDAFGGAAYYETDDTSYIKFDATDAKEAPFGYLIRTNYSFSRNIDAGYGYIRFQTADDLFDHAYAQYDITPLFLLQQADRNLYHSLTRVDLKEPPYPLSKNEPHFVDFQDFINRYSSASATVVQGVKPREPAELTTVWTILGFPLTSVAIPTWVAAGAPLPKVLTAPSGINAPLCDKALQLKKQCFPITRGSGEKYINLSVLLNQSHDGMLQLIPVIENEIVNEAGQKIETWRTKGFQKKEAHELYRWFDETITKSYHKYFGL